ncbi:MAG: hypothetical protein WCJ39_00970 [bacterium]
MIDNVVNMSNKTITENIEKPAEQGTNTISTASNTLQQTIDTTSNPINLQ